MRDDKLKFLRSTRLLFFAPHLRFTNLPGFVPSFVPFLFTFDYFSRPFLVHTPIIIIIPLGFFHLQHLHAIDQLNISLSLLFYPVVTRCQLHFSDRVWLCGVVRIGLLGSSTSYIATFRAAMSPLPSAKTSSGPQLARPPTSGFNIHVDSDIYDHLSNGSFRTRANSSSSRLSFSSSFNQKTPIRSFFHRSIHGSSGDIIFLTCFQFTDH